MHYCDTLIAPEWCVPVEPAGAALKNYAVIIKDGRILELMPAAEARACYQASALIERPGQVLIPGLVNAHTHAAMSLFRGLADAFPAELWLRDGIWPAEPRWLSPEMVRDGTELAIAEMLSAGITCFADQFSFPEIAAETAVDLQMRAVIGTPVVDMPTAWAKDVTECLSKSTDLVHDPYADHPLISSCFAPHSTLALTDESFRAIRVLADQLDLAVQIHLHETPAEITQSVETTGRRPLDRLADLGLVNASLLIVHGVHMRAAEIDRLAAAGVSVAHCPGSNLKCGSGIAPLVDYRKAGVNVAIGTDGAANNNVLDVLGELRAAARLARLDAGHAVAVPAAAALRMATLDAAAALGLADNIGSIERGKAADLTCIDLRRANSRPVYDPVEQVVYTAGADQVTDVWVAGRHQLDGGRLTQIDMADLVARSNEWQSRISKELPRTPGS